ncbi:hypothetical protein UA08_01982 [Talaromyces atroroseus]|uniref:SET domain-containing protein n=1 Tax=Talaromyces atroroseus TaxID=1441469 RepID=A0A1Q5QBW4_TALAT|nr:hypothetical protein UA08_01982 [Talaromyces atroroseus]OKL63442.1 hypothetical protein UA08_01982 [Talaromyces atroroseus]
MSAYSPPGEEHVAFMQWAIDQAVKVNGVEPARIPGRGLGMIATKDIQEDEIMVEVPLSAMLSIDSIPATFVNLFNGKISLQGLLAAFFTHGDPNILKKFDLWKATWPNMEDLEEGLPILWSKELGGLDLKHNSPNETAIADDLSTSITLPPSASGLWNTFRRKSLVEDYQTKHQNLLIRQEKRLRDAWHDVLAVFPDTNWETFAYYWLIINTRSFYYLMPGQERPEDTNEAMALVPFADYFNHIDNAECDVNFDGQTYTFRATKVYSQSQSLLLFYLYELIPVPPVEKGEEVYMSYGPHPNDFLFIECILAILPSPSASNADKIIKKDGFFLEENESDALYLDDIIFKDFTAAEKEELIFERYYGYVLRIYSHASVSKKL